MEAVVQEIRAYLDIPRETYHIDKKISHIFKNGTLYKCTELVFQVILQVQCEKKNQK